MILFDHVTKSYPRTTRPALDDVTAEVLRGEFVFVVGQSGSGKSTLLRLALREDVATSGRVLVAGRDLARLPERKVPHLRREIGVVFQDFRLLPGKNVYQNVAFALQVIGTSRSLVRQTVPETLAMVGLEGKEKRLPHELSGGEQQRVAIARAVVNKPAILLCDEPTGNLDPATSLDIVALLERINRAGTTIVMATHDDEIVNSFRKRVIELQLGRVQRDQHDAGYGVTGSVLPVVGPRTPEAQLGSWVDPETLPAARGAEEGDDDLVPAVASVSAPPEPRVPSGGSGGSSRPGESVDDPDPSLARPPRRRLSLRRS